MKMIRLNKDRIRFRVLIPDQKFLLMEINRNSSAGARIDIIRLFVKFNPVYFAGLFITF